MESKNLLMEYLKLQIEQQTFVENIFKYQIYDFVQTYYKELKDEDKYRISYSIIMMIVMEFFMMFDEDDTLEKDVDIFCDILKETAKSIMLNKKLERGMTEKDFEKEDK